MDKKVEVISLQPEFKTELKEENVYLKFFQSLTITNEGNVKNTQKVKHQVPLLKALFTTSEGKIERIEGISYITWEITLSPNEPTVMNFTTNYRVIIYILAILIIFAGFYFYVQSPISISKSAVTTRAEEEGTLSEIKITLEVKNKTSKVMKDIQITDQVPGIANVEKSLELGTLRPKEVRHTKKGTKAIWGLAEIDANEHRLITYKVRAKLNIVGAFSLPRAIVEYGKGKKKKKAYSNLFKLNN